MIPLAHLAEEPLKHAIKERYFKEFVLSGGKIDFQIYLPSDQLPYPLLWAEAKAGANNDLCAAFTQLVLSILQESQEDLPPFLGAFDGARFSVVESEKLQGVLEELASKRYAFAPSNHNAPGFKEAAQLLAPLLQEHATTFAYATQEEELQNFIASLHGKPRLKTKITRQNFRKVYDKWLVAVKPSIQMAWEEAEKIQVLEADFYLADLISKNDLTLKDINIRLVGDHYVFNEKLNQLTKSCNCEKTGFKDGQRAHKEFWKLYQRPPTKSEQKYILDRRDLLMSKREYRGAFYTPKIWAHKSKEYLAQILGSNYQDDYFLWDLAAGTGNLLVGLENPYHVFASTIDINDVKIIKERAQDSSDSLRIAHEHIFEFDFLEDPFSQLPQNLQEILNTPAKLSKLVIYINPPYAEAGSKSQIAGTGKNKEGVAKSKKTTEQETPETLVVQKYAQELGKARNEIFAQFFMRIVKEIAPLEAKTQVKETPPTRGESSYERWYHTNLSPQKQNLMYNTRLEPLPCFLDMDGSFLGFAPLQGQGDSTQSPLKIVGPILASFSTLKYLNSSNFKTFRAHFKARFLGGFMCPGNTFDHVKGSFPIGFLVWDLGAPPSSQPIILDIYDSKANFLGVKEFRAIEGVASINEWIAGFKVKEGWAAIKQGRGDFQNTNLVALLNTITEHTRPLYINATNLHTLSVYFSVQHCIKPTWINDRDQFYAPYDDSWQSDSDFLGDCLIFMLFHSQNRISCQLGANHFIPFKEVEVNPKARYTHHTLLEFLAGKSVVCASKSPRGLFKDNAPQGLCPTFSPTAQALLQAGKKLYAYYHAQEGSKPNASFYDIKEFFAGAMPKANSTPQARLQTRITKSFTARCKRA
ncbi:hypothetical protein [Helicobacter sp. L8]|uniref:hypothetical protein n=1 Tax=Helicobacter sp. L8 TaxID=2316078 RepID=UPI001969552C|nr:hypothetical protein [Helicobacter sp. L8]